MMKNAFQKSVWLFLPILILSLTVSISAQDIFRALKNERLAKELNLSPEQKETLKKVGVDSQEKRIDIEAQLKKNRLLLAQEMDKDDVNKEKVMGVIDEMGKAQTEMRKISVSQAIEAKKILNPEQREKARELITKWKSHQARQKVKERLRHHDRPDGPDAFKPGRGMEGKPEGGRFAPQRRMAPREDRPAKRGDRSKLHGGHPSPLFENHREKVLTMLTVPNPDF